MRTVYKYPVHFNNDAFMLSLHTGAEFVYVGVDPDKRASAWFEVDTERPVQHRYFQVHGTGHSIGIGCHIGSWVCDEFVWHLYEKFPL